MRSGATESALGGTAKVSSAGRVADYPKPKGSSRQNAASTTTKRSSVPAEPPSPEPARRNGTLRRNPLAHAYLERSLTAMWNDALRRFRDYVHAHPANEEAR
jgi:hypothetical protein